MPRRNRNARRKRRPVVEVVAERPLTYEAMARLLVSRGLVSPNVLDNPHRWIQEQQ